MSYYPLKNVIDRMGLVQLRKNEQQTHTSGGFHHDISSPTLSSLSKQTKMYNNALISSNNNNNLMSSINESKIPIVRDDSKTSSRLSHHLHHMTLRGRSKVRVRASVSIEHASPTRILRDTSSTTSGSNFDKTIDRNSNSISTANKSESENIEKQGITLELNATTGSIHPSGIPINNNNNVKRGKRSLSSTRIEKDKCDEYNTKLLRKATNGNNNINSSTATSNSSSATSVGGGGGGGGGGGTSSGNKISFTRRLGSTSLPNDHLNSSSLTAQTTSTINTSRNSKCSEQSLTLKLRKKISY